MAKRPEVVARQEAAHTRDRRGQGEPVLPSLRNVLGRTGFAAAALFVLLLVLRASPAAAALQAVILGAVMAPIYLLLDRIIYRRRVKRWNAKRDARP